MRKATEQESKMIPNALDALLDQIDASATLATPSGISGNSACGGKCYQGCKAELTEADYNLPNVQPSSNYRGINGAESNGSVDGPYERSGKGTVPYDSKRS